jgi:hypothetical protein
VIGSRCSNPTIVKDARDEVSCAVPGGPVRGRPDGCGDPETAPAGMAEWMTWSEKAGSAIVDLRLPLAPAAGSTVSSDSIGGFSILQADSAEALQAVWEGHPHTAHGGTIEVHEFFSIPGT